MARRLTVVAAGLALAVCGGGAAFAQAGGTAAPVQGFTPQMLIMKLSLYLPEDAVRGAFFGGGAGGAGGAAGQRAGAQGQAGTSAQAQAGTGTGAGQAGGAQGGARRQVLQFTRDQKLFLTKDQINKLLPILQALRENPMPSPTKARKVESDVDAILTAAQKAEWTSFQKQLESFQQNAQRQAAGAGSTGAGGAAGGTGAAGGAGSQGGGNGASGAGGAAQQFQNMTPEQRQAFLDNLPPEQRQAIQQRMQRQGQGGAGGAGGGQALTPTQRRQQQIDEFIAVLQARLKQI